MASRKEIEEHVKPDAIKGRSDWAAIIVILGFAAVVVVFMLIAWMRDAEVI